MLVRVWEYEVAPGCEAEFEQLYGSTGAWAQLFARQSGPPEPNWTPGVRP